MENKKERTDGDLARFERDKKLADGGGKQSVLPTPPAPSIPTPEQQAERQARVEKCSEAIKSLLVEHRCILTVPTLDISTGRLFPQIELRAQP